MSTDASSNTYDLDNGSNKKINPESTSVTHALAQKKRAKLNDSGNESQDLSVKKDAQPRVKQNVGSLRFSIRELLLACAVISVGLALKPELITDTYNEMRYSEWSQETEGFITSVLKYNKFKEENKMNTTTCYAALTYIEEIEQRASILAEKRGETLDESLTRVGINLNALKEESDECLTIMIKDLRTDDAISSEDPQSDFAKIRERYRHDTRIPVRMARSIPLKLNFSRENFGMTEDIEREILMKGMQRCVKQWHEEDSGQSNFSASSTFRSFAADLAMLFGVSEISDGSITVILNRNTIQMDLVSRENLLEEVKVAQRSFISRNIVEYGDKNGPWPTSGDRLGFLSQK